MSDWRDDAACSTAPPELFHPDRPHKRQMDTALAYCARCPVRGACREDAAAQVGPDGASFAYGVWGGEWWGPRLQTRVIDVLDEVDLRDLMGRGWTDGRVADHYGLTRRQVRRARVQWGITGQAEGRQRSA